MFVVPMTIFKRNILGASESGDWFCALEALFGEEFAKAIGAVRLFLFGSESLSCQRLFAVTASEAVAMVRIVLVRHTTRRNHLFAFGALGGEELLVASDAVVVVILGDEALRSQGLLAVVAGEAVLVPLLPFVLHLLGAWFEDLTAAVASRSELVSVTITAVNLIFFAAKRFVHQTVAADAAHEAPFVPVLLFVGEILGVCSYEFCAFFAGVGEKLFVASDAVRMFLSQDISLAREILVAVPTGKMLRVKFLVHGSCILAGENQLRSRLDAFFPK